MRWPARIRAPVAAGLLLMLYCSLQLPIRIQNLSQSPETAGALGRSSFAVA
jgi:hypothetical protein